MRKVILIHAMFQDIASRQELLLVDDLYARGAKGSAIVFMTKRVKRQWDKMLGKGASVESYNRPRTIKINEGGHSRVEAI